MTIQDFERDERAKLYETRLKAKLVGIYYSIKDNFAHEELDLSRFDAVETIPVIEQYINYQRDFISKLKKEIRELKSKTK